MSGLEAAVAVDSYPELKRWIEAAPGEATSWQLSLGEDNPIAAMLTGIAPQHYYFGSEFCEFLLPVAKVLERALRLVKDAGRQLTLMTPIACDGVIDRLRDILPLLPEDSELIVNDWGVASFARREFPHLRLAAGRLLCKMIKDPRLDNAVWADLYPHGLGGRSFRALLDRLAIARIELDLPPYARPDVFAELGIRAALHAPYALVAKGRLCKIGSLALATTQRYAPGRECQRECLSYAATCARPGKTTDLETTQRGNAIFYRHTHAMSATATAAVAQGWLQRIVVHGE